VNTGNADLAEKCGAVR